MTEIIVYLAYLGVSLELIGSLYAYFEMIATFALMKAGGKIDGSYTHTIEHLFIFALIVTCNLSLMFWLFIHKGIEHAWDIHIIQENLWGVIFLFGLLKIVLTHHLRKERKK